MSSAAAAAVASPARWDRGVEALAPPGSAARQLRFDAADPAVRGSRAPVLVNGRSTALGPAPAPLVLSPYGGSPGTGGQATRSTSRYSLGPLDRLPSTASSAADSVATALATVLSATRLSQSAPREVRSAERRHLSQRTSTTPDAAGRGGGGGSGAARELLAAPVQLVPSPLRATVRPAAVAALGAGAALDASAASSGWGGEGAPLAPTASPPPPAQHDAALAAAEAAARERNAVAAQAHALVQAQEQALGHARAAALSSALAEAGSIAASLAGEAAARTAADARKAHAALAAREHDAVSRAEREAAERYAAARRLTSEAVEWAHTYARDVEAAASLAAEQARKRAAAEVEAAAERARREEAERHAAAAAAVAAKAAAEAHARDAEAARLRAAAEQHAAVGQAAAAAAAAVAAAAQHAAAPAAAAAAAVATTTASAADAPPLPVGGRQYLAAAKRLVADLDAAQAVMVEKLGVKPEATLAAGGPAALAGAVPREAVAKSIWKAARGAVTRVIGTLEMTDYAITALGACLDDAATADERRPLAVLPRSVGCGLFTAYAADVIVAAFVKRAEGELPPGTTDDHLTVPFAFARVLAGLAASRPAFLRRYLGALYGACPFAVPTTSSLGAGGGGVAPETVSQLMAIYAAFLVTMGPLPPGVVAHHHHGIGQAWRLAARVLNAPPHRMGGRVLHSLLLYAGHGLANAYGRPHTAALLQAVATAYLPALERVPDVEHSHIEILRQVLLAADARGGQRFDAARVPLLAAPPKGADLPPTDTKTAM
jgi:hypothetical protein